MRSGRSSRGAQADWGLLRSRVVRCRKCPRLVRFRESVAPRASFKEQAYWRRPVPGFGDVDGRLLVIGIAPAAHGGNRTGRVFTGDSSGRFLVRALHATGFASAPISEGTEDGLVYNDCYVTAAVKCAPPGDRPTPDEFRNCSTFLDSEVAQLKNLKAVLVLGGLSFRAYTSLLRRKGVETRGLKFEHGKAHSFDRLPALFSCFHPSPRNTNTGKLTPQMLLEVLGRVKTYLRTAPS